MSAVRRACRVFWVQFQCGWVRARCECVTTSGCDATDGAGDVFGGISDTMGVGTMPKVATRPSRLLRRWQNVGGMGPGTNKVLADHHSKSLSVTGSTCSSRGACNIL